MKLRTVMLGVVLLSGCQARTARDNNAANDVAPAPVKPMQAPPSATNETASVALPNDRTPLAEPKGPIDPKTTEAAGQVVQHYGALIEERRFAEAGNYWRDTDSAAAFGKKLKLQGLEHLEIGKPGDPEGAAGSIYVTVPVIFYGDTRRRAADVILRRVNDVPGSTEEQRRWHVERIEWKA